ncbi:histidine phosphatase family protein [Uliginosibacterium sediminicola]|uniref:Histidine phosphatase family protein n=2 Tax=Uliginosibacterium sediminicola TaxID=2024550 RepID=A0ABU9YX52_9RHOO
MGRRLFLLRHAPVALAEGICYGRSDVALRQPVAEHARAAQAHLPRELAVFSSPLQRCRLLAEALHPAPQIDARLAEMDFGDWELRSWNEVPREGLDAWARDPLGYSVAGGESGEQVRTRVLAALHEILAANAGDVLIVSHGGPLRFVRAALLGADFMAEGFPLGALYCLQAPAAGQAQWRQLSAHQLVQQVAL